MREDQISVVSVSLPASLLKQSDALMQRRGFSGRSELVRAALRDFVAKESQEPQREGPRSATMTLVYPKGQERRIAEIRHDFSDISKSTVHSDATDSCVEIFLLQGPGARIRAFADRLRAYREVRLVQAIYTDV